MPSKRKTHDGYYVTAIIDGGTANQRVSYLLGPFATLRAAEMMVRPATHAANKTHDPRFAFASFGCTKLTKPIDTPLPPGRLDLWAAVDDVWISHVVAPRGY